MAATPQPFKRLRTFSFVIQPEVLIVWLGFSGLISGLIFVTMKLPTGILAGIWWLIIAVIFTHYCIMIVESTARGHQNVPKMTADGFFDTRILKLGTVASFSLSATFATPLEWRPATVAVVLFFLPAMTAYITIANSMASALNPVRVVHFIINMGLGYFALRMVITSVMVYILFLIHNYTTVFASFIGIGIACTTGVYLLLVMSRCVGALLHSRRRELGISTSFSPEQAEAEITAHDNEVRARFLRQVYELQRVHEYAKAWQILEKQLKRDRYETEHLYFNDLVRWEDRALAHKVAQGYLKRLVATNTQLAWSIFEDILEEEQGNYRLDSGPTVIKLAETASTERQRRTILEVLGHFDEDFPAHPKSRQAFLLATELACELGDMETARTCFHLVNTRRGLIHKSTYERCKQLIESDSRADLP